ncbi:MAG: 2-(1,2-epoxy-1,2-dihydrophenyl)acetyl-CoA isomerase [Calditrichaeota bacterium]|nr:MAG: 2-(1,2-epoxy-1,2-dihydrophenyl)acetyl-CoA isomerase [Calditrichota bacterium]
MAYQFVKFQMAEGVAEIVLNRPDVLNSFNRTMGKEVQAALREAAGEPNVRAVLLTGAGRAFCAGQDLQEVVPEDPNQDWGDISEIVRETYNPVVLGIREIEKPVVCAVNGVAAGAGANIALACDFVFASEKASFIQAFAKIGLIPDSGGTFFLPRLVGLARATAMTMLGEKISAQQALDWGMIYRVCPPDSLLEEARNFARRLATMPTRGLGLTKCLLNKSLFNSLEEQLKLEERAQGLAGKTHDYREGVLAFLEKREPRFKGE